MAERIRQVDYYAMGIANRAGEAAKILAPIAAAGVNLLAFTGFPSGGRAQIDFIPENAAKFQAAAKRAKLRLKKKKTGFLVQGDDRAGAVARLLGRLAKAKINITAIDAVSAGKGRYGAILWVKPKDIKKAAKILNAR